MKRVKRCWKCDCRFICNSNQKSDCDSLEECLCDPCYTTIVDKFKPILDCNTIIIKRGNK